MRPVRDCTSDEPPPGVQRWELRIVKEKSDRTDAELADTLGRTRWAVREMRRWLRERGEAA